MKKIKIKLDLSLPVIGVNVYGDSENPENWYSAIHPDVAGAVYDGLEDNENIYRANHVSYISIIKKVAEETGIPARAIRCYEEDEEDEDTIELIEQVDNRWSKLIITDKRDLFVASFYVNNNVDLKQIEDDLLSIVKRFI